MNRLLLPAGLVLAGMFAFDRASDWDTRLSLLEHEPRSAPEALTALRSRLETQQAGLSLSLEQGLQVERDLAAARQLADAQQIAELREQLAEQRSVLEEQRRRLTEWEMDWNQLAPSALQGDLYELHAKLDSQELEFELSQRRLAEREVRAAKEYRDLQGRLEHTLVEADSGQLWNDLVGPVVQLIGDTSVGSGVLLESREQSDGKFATNVLTAWHVVRDIFGAPDNLSAPVPVKIYAPDGTWRNLTAHMLLHDVRLDLALLSLDTNERIEFGARLATRSELAAMRTFDGIYAVGCPLGNDPIPTVGELASTHHEVDGSKYWMISAPTYIGNSGGGIYSARTHALVGIFSKIYTHGSTRTTIVPHMGLATPLAVVYDWLEASDYAFLEAQTTQADTQTAAAKR